MLDVASNYIYEVVELQFKLGSVYNRAHAHFPTTLILSPTGRGLDKRYPLQISLGHRVNHYMHCFIAEMFKVFDMLMHII